MTQHIFNLAGIRDAVLSKIDWAPGRSAEAKRRLNLFIQMAYNRMATEAPFCFFQKTARLALEPDVSPGSAEDTLEVANGDQWVLQTELQTGAPGAALWEQDKDWRARWVLLTVPDTSPPERHLIRIRDVWEENLGAVSPDRRMRISLERPWRNATDTGIVWKIITDEFLLPDNFILAKNISLADPSYNRTYTLPVYPTGAFENFAEADPSHATSLTTGIPEGVYRTNHHRLPAPTFTPTVDTDASPWDGGEAQGTFQYLVTYSWGKNEFWTHSPGPHTQATKTSNPDRYEPLLESGPSGESAAITTTGSAIAVGTPDLSHMLGFASLGTERYHHTGLVKRVYRKRTEAGTGTLVEAPNRYYFLTEEPAWKTEFVDDGTVTPDYGRPFRTVHGHVGYRVYPKPTSRVELVLRYIERPEPLTDDGDVPQMHEDALGALVELVKAQVYETMGNGAAESRSLAKYEQELHTLKKTHGQLTPARQVRRRSRVTLGRSRGPRWGRTSPATFDS